VVSRRRAITVDVSAYNGGHNGVKYYPMELRSVNASPQANHAKGKKFIFILMDYPFSDMKTQRQRGEKR